MRRFPWYAMGTEAHQAASAMCGKSPILAVSAVVVNEGRVVLVRRGSEPNRGLWSLRGGKVGLGERLEDAVRRELLEETGLAVSVQGPFHVSELVFTADKGRGVHYVVLVFRGTCDGCRLVPGSDAADAAWVIPSELHSFDVTPGLGDVVMKGLSWHSPAWG